MDVNSLNHTLYLFPSISFLLALKKKSGHHGFHFDIKDIIKLRI